MFRGTGLSLPSSASLQRTALPVVPSPAGAVARIPVVALGRETVRRGDGFGADGLPLLTSPSPTDRPFSEHTDHLAPGQALSVPLGQTGIPSLNITSATRQLPMSHRSGSWAPEEIENC